MIGSIDVKLNGKAHTLRLSTKAMARVERDLGTGILQVAETMQGDFKVGTVASLFAASMNDGKGGDIDDAYDIIDAVGLAGISETIGQLFEAAFPDQDDTAGNVVKVQAKG